MNLTRVWILILAAMSLLGGAEPSIRGPVTGWWLDLSTRSLRPLLGMPGAAVLGPPLELDREILAAEIAPSQDYAVVQVAGDTRFWLLRLDGSPGPEPLSVAISNASRVFFSPKGRSAVIYDGGMSRIQVLTRLPRPNGDGWESALPAQAGSLASLAISDDGTVVLASFTEDDAGSIWILRRDEEGKFLLPTDEALAVFFLADSFDAVVADRGRNTVLLIRNAAGNREIRILAGPSDGLTAPFAAQATRDNRQVVFLHAGAEQIGVVELAGGPVRWMRCGCRPSGLEPLMGNAVFRLVETGTRPLLLLDGDWPEPRVVFVPAETRGPSGPARARR